MQFLHAGDELVVLRLDRLGRSTRDLEVSRMTVYRVAQKAPFFRGCQRALAGQDAKSESV